MNKGHPFDHSVQRRHFKVEVKRWPDEYYEVDFAMGGTAGDRLSACMPLFSGKSPIDHARLQEIKHLCQIAVETIIEVDFEPDPF
jgi:hypothetical protein